MAFVMRQILRQYVHNAIHKRWSCGFFLWFCIELLPVPFNVIRIINPSDIIRLYRALFFIVKWNDIYFGRERVVWVNYGLWVSTEHWNTEQHNSINPSIYWYTDANVVVGVGVFLNMKTITELLLAANVYRVNEQYAKSEDIVNPMMICQ